MEIQSEEGLLKAYDFLKQGNPDQAKTVLETVLENDLDNEEVIFAIRCSSFWIEYIKQLTTINDDFERGEALLTEWKSFKSFIAREEHPVDRTLYAVQRGIFSLARRCYSGLGEEREPVRRSEIYSRTGLCCKKLGEYEAAKNCLIEANNLQPGTAAVLAEMADCYALCGEDRKAKVLFREAFFLDPERIDISFLDSELICCLIRQVEKKGYTGTVLQEWIPVYGVLLGVFNVKRVQRSQEIGKLKQEIYAKENESKDPASDSSILTPRLINMYFRLIDYYVLSDGNEKNISDILLKIKILDPEIHKLYVK
ncbi:MAG: hypothetical protein LKF96_10145 [Treponema sp.]|jgi:tetratricopeptide (TPR) repeat protein|nr:hypothetical protein [Treponema sp.]